TQPQGAERQRDWVEFCKGSGEAAWGDCANWLRASRQSLCNHNSASKKTRNLIPITVHIKMAGGRTPAGQDLTKLRSATLTFEIMLPSLMINFT
ncbi:MAG: hypothetical protein NWS01_01095, partial [Burkholderiales bacterium]|nr:hypothetical protein [Burkholderiales bacterium]